MTERCVDLDEFFDGELAADQADAFRDHLATCERCQRVLDGRMQESIAVRAPLGLEQPAAAPAIVGAVAPVPAARIAAAATPARGGPTAPIDRRRMRWGRLVYAAPLVAAAAAVPLWLGHRGEPGFQLSLTIGRASGAERGAEAPVPGRRRAAHTGDVLRPRVQGERHLAIWVYLDERELLVRCPEDVRCRSTDGKLTLELTLAARGSYAIIAAGSGEALPPPGPTLDRTLATARTAGVRTQVEYVAVD